MTSSNNFTFQQDGAPAHRSRQTVAFLRLHVPELVEPENWPLNSPDLSQWTIWSGEHKDSLFTIVVTFEMSTWKKPCKSAGSRFVKTLSITLKDIQTIIARCSNWYKTHWAPLWLVFLVLHVHYQTYVFCCRNTELGQQKSIVWFILHHPVLFHTSVVYWMSDLLLYLQ